MPANLSVSQVIWSRQQVINIFGFIHVVFNFLARSYFVFLDPKSGSQKSTVVVVLVVVISSLEIPKAFLVRSGVQRNFAYTFALTFPTDLPSQIFHLLSN